MLNKTKYTVLILSANIFLCSAEKECEIFKLFTTKKQEDIKNNESNIELPEIGQNQNEETTNVDTKLDKNKKTKKHIILKDILDYGLKQKTSEEAKESVEGFMGKNLEMIEKLIKGFESSKLPQILKKIVNTEKLIETYKNDEKFKNLSCVEQMKLVLMFWCLQSQINFDFQNETIEQFTAKITYSNIKNTLNKKIEELIKEEKNTKKETSEGNIPEEDSKKWESYNIFKINDKENIKDLFYYFIKECILTSIAILIHKYCALCKDKFGDVFIVDGKGKTIEYRYTQKNSSLFNSSDDGDTIAQTEKLFSSNPKYTRICNITFEDLTKLIHMITKLPHFNEPAKQNNKDEGVNKLNLNTFKDYKELLDFVKKREEELRNNGNKKIDLVHFYDIDKFFNMKIEPNKDPEDLELLLPDTFGDLINQEDAVKKYISKNIHITFKFKSSKHQIISLSFENCKFTNNGINITDIIKEEKNIENEKNESDNEVDSYCSD